MKQSIRIEKRVGIAGDRSRFTHTDFTNNCT